MRKLTLMFALVFSVAAANVFAGDKTDKEKGKEKPKLNTPGKSCGKSCEKKETKEVKETAPAAEKKAA